jgi:membrane-bound lytic murein transglycosylase B
MIHRRLALKLLGLAAFASAASAAAPDPIALGAFLAQVWPSAQAAGVSRATFDRETAGLTLDPALLAKPAAQGEFSLSPRAYLAQTVSDSRVAGGRARLAARRATFDAIEHRFGVPADIVVALWSLESAFGTGQGNHDILRSLATLAIIDSARTSLFRDEFVAALLMIERGKVRRETLVGSWAGATGQPQFMPSSYLKYAVPLSGDRPADIWRSADDSLASIANFMRQSGWAAGLPAVIEVRVPANFDWRPIDLDLAQWQGLGFRRIDGGMLPPRGAASLFLPAGARGPALLITDNFEAIRAYNTSDAYALAVFVLGERMAGRPGLVAPWPPDGQRLSASGRRTLQEQLVARGFYKGTPDGRFGRATRLAVHAFQIAEGIVPADGFATPGILARLGGE